MNYGDHGSKNVKTMAFLLSNGVNKMLGDVLISLSTTVLRIFNCLHYVNTPLYKVSLFTAFFNVYVWQIWFTGYDISVCRGWGPPTKLVNLSSQPSANPNPLCTTQWEALHFFSFCVP